MNEDDKTEAFSIFFDDGICGIDVTLKEASAPGDRMTGKQLLEGTMGIVWLVSIHCNGVGRAMAIILRG